MANAPHPQTLLDWAKYYAFTLGWVIIPIHRIVGHRHDGTQVCSCEVSSGKKWKNCGGKAGKHPWVKWGQLTTPQEGFDSFMRVFNENPNGVNIGIRTGRESGIWAIDIDVGANKHGVEALEAWLTKNKLSYPELNAVALIQRTGGGGFHYIFNYPAEGKIPTVAPHKDMGPDVDIKGHGGYIIGEPSLHHMDVQYGFEGRMVASREEINDAPAIVVAAVFKQQRGPGTTSIEEYTPDRLDIQMYADELAAKRHETSKRVGVDMQEALKGNAIAGEGGAHDGYRDIMFFIAKRWKRCNPDEIVAHFEDSVAARFAHKPDASTDIENVMDAMQSALAKVHEESTSWSAQVMMNSEGRVIANDANMLLFFRNHDAWKGVFGFDLRMNKPVYIRRPPLVRASEDLDMTSDKSETALWFQTRGGMSGRFAQNDMSSAIMAVSKDQAFDPLVDMLNELRGQWDGTPRLATAMQRVAGVPDDAWSRLVFRKWMISAIARIMIPGSKVDTMFILEGSQGFKKSTFFSTLLPETRYFSDGVSKVKQDVETLRLIHSGPLIFELGELSGLRKQEVDEIKAFLSGQEDLIRPLYEAPRQMKRRCIFVGSTNLNDYLRDSTGGRRFWPVVVTKVIDIKTVKEERAQWWAEALDAFGEGRPLEGRGERWWLEGGGEDALAAAEQDKRYEEDVWTPTVLAWLGKMKVPVPDGGVKTSTDQMQQDITNTPLAGIEHVTVLQVLKYAVEVDVAHARGAEAKRIEGILRRAGWVTGRVREGCKQVRAWKRPIGE